jgi:hypothetical protein
MVRIACGMVALAWVGAAHGAEVTLLSNARVITMDSARPYASALAWDDGGRIVGVGDADELRRRHADHVALDAGGRVVVPGLIDAHGHVLGLGLTLDQADLVGTSSKAEVIERLQAFEKTLPADAWLLGRGWDQNDWPEKVFPTAVDLDAAFPKRPVWLQRVDGHAGWANSAALKLATRDLAGDWQPGGGKILREGTQPSGVLIDGAMNLIEGAVPSISPAMTERALDVAMRKAASLGLTGVHDAGVSRAELAVYRKLADAGRMPIRVYAMADGDGAAVDDLCANGLYHHEGGRLTMRAVKLYADGALGSRGAALLADYSDDAGNRGLLVTEPEALGAAIAKAQRCKVQVAVHAIGDRGNRAVLDAFAPRLRAAGAGDVRWRIEHAQVVALEDIARFAALRVIASMQPTHATSDMPWAEARVGAARIVGGYAWRRFRDAGVVVAFGSDFPVEAVDPLLGLYAAVTRQDADGAPAGGWYPDQRVTAWEALRGFTLDAAYAAFMDDEVGSLAVGKRADFTVLSRDPLREEPRALLQTRAIATYVDGKSTHGAL